MKLLIFVVIALMFGMIGAMGIKHHDPGVAGLFIMLAVIVMGVAIWHKLNP